MNHRERLETWKGGSYIHQNAMLTVDKTRELKEEVGKVRSWKHNEL